MRCFASYLDAFVKTFFKIERYEKFFRTLCIPCFVLNRAFRNSGARLYRYLVFDKKLIGDFLSRYSQFSFVFSITMEQLSFGILFLSFFFTKNFENFQLATRSEDSFRPDEFFEKSSRVISNDSHYNHAFYRSDNALENNSTGNYHGTVHPTNAHSYYVRRGDGLSTNEDDDYYYIFAQNSNNLDSNENISNTDSNNASTDINSFFELATNVCILVLTTAKDIVLANRLILHLALCTFLCYMFAAYSSRLSNKIGAGARETEVCNVSNALEMVFWSSQGKRQRSFAIPVYHFLIFVECVVITASQYTLACCLFKELVYDSPHNELFLKFFQIGEYYKKYYYGYFGGGDTNSHESSSSGSGNLGHPGGHHAGVDAATDNLLLLQNNATSSSSSSSDIYSPENPNNVGKVYYHHHFEYPWNVVRDKIHDW